MSTKRVRPSVFLLVVAVVGALDLLTSAEGGACGTGRAVVSPESDVAKPRGALDPGHVTETQRVTVTFKNRMFRSKHEQPFLFQHLPSVEDIVQIDGDCWLLATLIAIISSKAFGPSAIVGSMVLEGGGKVAVRMYDWGEKVIVEVPLDAKTKHKHNAEWVHVFEKATSAFAVEMTTPMEIVYITKSGKVSHPESSRPIMELPGKIGVDDEKSLTSSVTGDLKRLYSEGGQGEQGFFVFLGMLPAIHSIGTSDTAYADRIDDPNRLIDVAQLRPVAGYLNAALDADLPVVAETWSSFVQRRQTICRALERGHAYAVVSIDCAADKGTITLINPKHTKVPFETSLATFAMCFSTFVTVTTPGYTSQVAAYHKHADSFTCGPK